MNQTDLEQNKKQYFMDTMINYSFKKADGGKEWKSEVLNKSVYNDFMKQQPQSGGTILVVGNKSCKETINQIKNSLISKYDDFDEFYESVKNLHLLNFEMSKY